MSDASLQLIREKLFHYDPDSIEPHFSELRKKFGDRCEAIVAYGSTLSAVTRSKTSTPDFYLIVSSYSQFHKSWLHALLNWFLPPNIYHFEIDGRVSKYNVLSKKDLMRETGACSPDCYNLGRMSKRIAIANFKDENIVTKILQAHFEAMNTIAKKVYYLMPPEFTLETFTKTSLRFSYMADVRVEAEDKVDRLFEADRDYYLSLYEEILKGPISQKTWIEPRNVPQTYLKKTGTLQNHWGAFQTNYFLWKSQLRAQMRWPKGIFTVKGWVDYLLAKVERTQGIKLGVTEHEKRFWYIYGWKYFFRLRRKNLIK